MKLQGSRCMFWGIAASITGAVPDYGLLCDRCKAMGFECRLYGTVDFEKIGRVWTMPACLVRV